MRQRTYIIPFAQGVTGSTATNDLLGGDYGSTSHINPWLPVGSDKDKANKVQLYGYDDNSSQSDRWYLNVLDSTIENDVYSPEYTLKYLKKEEENINIRSFQCDKLSIEVHKELNYYYELKYIIIGSQPFGSSGGSTTGPQYFERFEVSSVDGDVYHFNINTVLRVESIDQSFILGLRFRRETLHENDSQIEVHHDPVNTVLFKLVIDGKNYTNNTFNIGSSGSIDLREYRKRLYIRDKDFEHGYLAYSHIKEKYRYVSGGTTYNMYEFAIIDSVLYNVNVEGTDFGNNVLIPELRIKNGKLVMSITDLGLLVNPELSRIEFCQVSLHDDQLGKVPDANQLLTITKSRDYLQALGNF
jgi:hypothetical protein